MQKALLVAFAIVAMVSNFTNSAFALSLAPRITVVAVQNVSESIERVTVDNYGEMVIQLRDSDAAITKQLSEENRSEIQYRAYNLSMAEIAETRHPVVCMMMPSPYQPMLQTSLTNDHGKFTGELRNILSEHNCAMSLTIAPKDSFARQIAAELKTVLLALANEFVEIE